MLKRYLSKLRFRSKGDLNQNFGLHVQQAGRKVIGITPILSIFALVGMLGYATIVIGFGEVKEVQAEGETIGNTASLIIDNGNLTDSITTAGGVTYSSHKVRVKADNITGYDLKIKGPVGLTGGSTISGAGGQTPANMAANTWGYAFGSDTDNNESTLAYQSFNGSEQTLNDNNPAVSNYSVDFTKKLVFAVKFADNAANGHYTGAVTLNLAVTPRAVVNFSVNYEMNGGTGGPTNLSGIINDTNFTYHIPDIEPTTSQSGYKFDGYNTDNGTKIQYRPGDKIILDTTDASITLYAIYKLSAFPSTLTTMQGMTPEICASVATGVSKSLKDSGRGNKSYTIQKLYDGNCWMTSNLALDLSSYSLTTSNSDVSETYTKGTATKNDSTWSSNDSLAQFTTNGMGGSDYKTAYGYYYSWCAATAGTCSGATTKNVDASSSICPKGWRLPSGKTEGWANNDFLQLMLTTNYNGWDGTQKITTTNFPPDGFSSGVEATELRIAGDEPATFYVSGAKWYYNGFVLTSGLSSANTQAFYWTRTAGKFNNSYRFTMLSSGTLYPAHFTYSETSYIGCAVRCVAYSN